MASEQSEKAQSYATLENPLLLKLLNLRPLLNHGFDELSAVTTKLTIYDFQVSVAQSRTDAESLEFITKVKATRKSSETTAKPQTG
ncbi:hypothetical protein O9993_15920 [Vibrio lentus]|nr:hypothetical protein [Vibrio lentus]